MRVILIALLAAISYAQTEFQGLRPESETPVASLYRQSDLEDKFLRSEIAVKQENSDSTSPPEAPEEKKEPKLSESLKEMSQSLVNFAEKAEENDASSGKEVKELKGKVGELEGKVEQLEGEKKEMQSVVKETVADIEKMGQDQNQVIQKNKKRLEDVMAKEGIEAPNPFDETTEPPSTTAENTTQEPGVETTKAADGTQEPGKVTTEEAKMVSTEEAKVETTQEVKAETTQKTDTTEKAKVETTAEVKKETTQKSGPILFAQNEKQTPAEKSDTTKPAIESQVSRKDGRLAREYGEESNIATANTHQNYFDPYSESKDHANHMFDDNGDISVGAASSKQDFHLTYAAIIMGGIILFYAYNIYQSRRAQKIQEQIALLSQEAQEV